jgi:two-component system sensor histidine kinase BaeS
VTAPPPAAAPKRRTGLASRLAIVTTAVAALAVLVSGLVSLGLLRGATQNEGRQQLAKQANGYVFIVDSAARNFVRFRSLARVLQSQQGITLEAINASGQACAIANPAIQLPSDVATQVVAGHSVSAVARVGGARRFIEARPLGAGQAGAVLANTCPAVAIALLQKVSDARVLATPLRDRLLIALAVGLVGAALAGFLLARRLARPLQHAAAAARALAGGRRDVAVKPEGPAEVAEVAEALNGLTAALARSEGRQRDFLLSISHELRTPLTSVTGRAEALADGVIEGDDVRDAGAVMLSEAHRLNRLVSDLLDLARLGADDFRIDLAPTDLTALVRGAEQVWRPRCAAEGIDLRLELPPAPLMIVTDGGRVRQILDGLAENALRVVPQGAPIVFAVAPDPVYTSYAVLQVRDGGPGLTPEDCAVAFERSTLYERYKGIRRVGTGLGLALVAGLANALGGSAVAGRAPEGGAAFTIRLPFGSRPT